jgi:hypothetical protein
LVVPETREKVYRTPEEHARDEADAHAHGWSAVRRERLPDGSVRVLYENPNRSEWAAQPQAPDARAAGRSDLNLAAVGVTIGGLVVVAGAFLPWVTLMGISVNGMEGSDGWLVIAVGGLLALIGLANLKDEGRASVAIGGILLGLLAVVIGGSKVQSIQDIASADDVLTGRLVQVGVGVYAIIAGGVIGALAALGLRGPGRRPKDH